MPEYLTVSDFLANDSQMSKKISGLRDGVDAVDLKVSSLQAAFKNYVAETDTYRLETSKQLSDLRSDLNDLKQAVSLRLDTLERTMERGFALIFARLGIQA